MDIRCTVKRAGNLEPLAHLCQAEAVHIAFARLGVTALDEDRQDIDDGLLSIVIAPDDASHGFVDGNDGSASAANTVEFDES